jgi:DNA-binding transcriptional ArsR family regulator
MITLNTGLQLRSPLTPRLLQASADTIKSYRLIGKGLGVHWDEVDEDLSLRSFLEDARVDLQALKEQVKTPVINVMAAKTASMVLRAVNHKLRQQILSIIRSNPGVTAAEIRGQLLIDQGVADQHLAILRRAGILIAKPEGQTTRYQLNHARLEELNRAMNLLAA